MSRKKCISGGGFIRNQSTSIQALERNPVAMLTAHTGGITQVCSGNCIANAQRPRRLKTSKSSWEIFRWLVSWAKSWSGERNRPDSVNHVHEMYTRIIEGKKVPRRNVNSVQSLKEWFLRSNFYGCRNVMLGCGFTPGSRSRTKPKPDVITRLEMEAEEQWKDT